ncbi:hypothetical protein [Bradyrhizobium sp. 27S5]|uniref:hypothetical protein n=1 Tax=Bradyrhizobium sp. 27S5 TaxID=3139728 RepID=UPI0030CA8021
MKATSNSATGAEQLSSSLLTPDSGPIAGQGVKNDGEPSGVSQIPSGGTGMNRRSVMNMFVSGAALAGAAVVGEPRPAESAEMPKAFDVDTARPELRDAIKTLEEAYYALRETDAVHSAAFKTWREWETKNPCPPPGRAEKKWYRRSGKVRDELGLDASLEARERAQHLYRSAQLDVGKVGAVNFEELALKAAASVAFEGGISESSRHHLLMERQLVAFSVALDAVSLATAAGYKPPENWALDPENRARSALMRTAQKNPGALERDGKLTEAGLLTRYQSFLVQELQTVSWVLYREPNFARNYVIFDDAVRVVCERERREASLQEPLNERRAYMPFFDEDPLPERARAVLGSLGIDTLTPDLAGATT